MMIYRGYDIIETKTNVGISSFTIMQNDKRIANGGTTDEEAMNKIDSIERERVARDKANIQRVDAQTKINS